MSIPLQKRGACALLAAVFLVACAVASAAKPEIDPSYADGKTYYMIGPHTVVNAIQKQPQLYAHAEELYIVAYPQDALPLPSGYQPQCNPCFHPGLPAPFVFHDHVLTGAPGLGKNGTAQEYEGPWKIIVMMYTEEAVSDPNFVPVKSEAELDAAEAAGKFQPIAPPGSENPYEFETGNVLICPFVAPEA